ncbi:MAG TPA: phosphoglucomutase/phosphomannomutase family protein [Terriglobales bacterium]|nr:phosphoglucomutase/phosphomannomutase family protein [Terriglobales bacterium]
MTVPIKFGTDGWRGQIADDFTFDNVRRVAAAMAAYVHRNEDPKQGLIVGYDTRFASKRAAELAAETIAATGIAVRLARDATPTPAISYAVKHTKAAGGVVITSSHNPWSWNGVKYKAGYGGSATPAIMAKIAALLPEQPPAQGLPSKKGGSVTVTDFKQPYVEAITKFADLGLIQRAGYKIAIDCMYGAGRGVLAGIFREHGIAHEEIRGELNPLFPGINPEPIEPHVRALQEKVVAGGFHAGFATDGDADRIGAVAEDGSFVDAHKCFAVLLKWLLDHKKWPGAVTRAFNTTGMLDRIAKKYGRELIEHGIGFKYVCDVVLSGKEVLVGGEESGGIGIPRHLPERDGVLNSLLLANAMASYGRTLGELVADLQKEFGPHYYGRRDLHLAEDVKQAAIRRAKDGIGAVGRYRVTRTEDMDGYKLFLDAPVRDGGAEAWVLLRASGTEPLLRVYSEASSPELVHEILAEAEALVTEQAARVA